MGAWAGAPVTYHFILNNDWHDTRKPAIYLPTLNNYTLMESPSGEHQVPENFQTTELPGVSPRPKKSILQGLGGL